MTRKSVKGSARGGGDGGGGGGGGGIVVSDSFIDIPSTDTSDSGESIVSASNSGGDLHWLLPNIAEAIEILEGATAEEVQAKIEELTSVKYPSSDLVSGLENGTELGLFEVQRLFSLNHRYLSSEFIAENDKEFVSLLKKKLREEYELARSKNTARDKGKKNKEVRKNWAETRKKKKPRQKMCERCRKRVNIMVENTSDAESYTSASIESWKSEKSSTKTNGKRHARQEENPMKKKKELSPSPQDYISRSGHHYPSDNVRKSKLLVETNPLKKEPPDIMFM